MTIGARWQRWVVHLLAGTMVVLGLVALTPTAPAEALCNGRSYFGDKHYCPATIEGVTATTYGTGRRVWLSDVIVYSTPPSTVTVFQERYQECPPGQLCGAGFFYPVSLTVPWTGTHRPRQGLVIRLYGTTTAGSLTPAGYVMTGDCGPRFELC